MRLNAEQQAEVDRLVGPDRRDAELTAEQLLARRAVPFRASLGYDPTRGRRTSISSRPRRCGSTAPSSSCWRKNGFVISDKRRYPHFAYGYKTIYSQDLPVFISADSILQAVHQSYDAILKALELEALVPSSPGC